MSGELLILVAAAASIGFFHTLLGPDHYLPFIVMSRSGKWSLRKTTLVTLLCGLGHVMGSIVLGIFGISLGIAVLQLESVESVRGNLATWVLIAFGLLYFVWGLRRALRNKPHQHVHTHEDGDHVHTHVHSEKHIHIHQKKGKKSVTPWVLFIIFILGPCEPLIPVLMYPAAKSSFAGMVLVASVFGGVTILTMLGVVIISTFGVNLIPTRHLERYTHAIAGAIICFCGISMLLFGL
jgi:ABC-type nickel/cobalt efflux system permease component RcnA